MSRKAEFVLLQLCVGFIAVIGSIISVKIKHGASQFWYYLPGAFTIALWAFLIKRSPYNLLVTSVVWDVVYDVVWTLMIIFVLKESRSWTQAAGALIVLAGCLIMGWGQNE